jgi:hypothetical protein
MLVALAACDCVARCTRRSGASAAQGFSAERHGQRRAAGRHPQRCWHWWWRWRQQQRHDRSRRRRPRWRGAAAAADCATAAPPAAGPSSSSGQERKRGSPPPFGGCCMPLRPHDLHLHHAATTPPTALRNRPPQAGAASSYYAAPSSGGQHSSQPSGSQSPWVAVASGAGLGGSPRSTSARVLQVRQRVAGITLQPAAPGSPTLPLLLCCPALGPERAPLPRAQPAQQLCRRHCYKPQAALLPPPMRCRTR